MNDGDKMNSSVNAPHFHSGIICFLLLFCIFMITMSNTFAQENAKAWFQQGVLAVEPAKKIASYKKAIELDPFFVEAYYNLGLVYKEQGLYNSAEEQFRLALGANPEGVNNESRLKVLYELGVTCKELHRYDEAKVVLQRASDLRTKSALRADVLYEIGMLNILLKQFDEAIIQLNEGIKIFPDQADQFNKAIIIAKNQKLIRKLYRQGLKYARDGKYAEATKAFKKVQELQPDYEDVSEQIERAQKEMPTLAVLTTIESDLYAKALSEMQNKNYAKAIDLFEQVMLIAPGYKDIRTKLSEAKRAHESSKSLSELEEHYERGNRALAQKDWLEAYTAFEKVKTVDPDYKLVATKIQQAKTGLTEAGNQNQANDPETVLITKYYNEALAAYNSKNWSKAIFGFQMVIEIDPKYKDALIRYKKAKRNIELAEQKKRRSMEEDLKRKSVELHFEKGLVNIERDDWVKALVNFEKANVLNPDYPNLQEKLRLVRSKIQGNKQESKEEKMADSKSPSLKQSNSSWIVFSIGFIIILGLIVGICYVRPSARARFYIINGKYDNARAIYEGMLTMKPDDEKIHSTLANIYLLENRTDEAAIRIYETILKRNINTRRNEDIKSILKEYYENHQNNDNGKDAAISNETLAPQLNHSLKAF